jgi:hypothetical protein
MPWVRPNGMKMITVNLKWYGAKGKGVVFITGR